MHRGDEIPPPQQNPASRLMGFGTSLPGRFGACWFCNGLVIGAAPAFAGVVSGRRVGRGRHSPRAAVANAAVHALAAFPSPALLSLVAQFISMQKIFAVLYRNTAIPSR